MDKAMSSDPIPPTTRVEVITSVQRRRRPLVDLRESPARGRGHAAGLIRFAGCITQLGDARAVYLWETESSLKDKAGSRSLIDLYQLQFILVAT